MKCFILFASVFTLMLSTSPAVAQMIHQAVTGTNGDDTQITTGTKGQDFLNSRGIGGTYLIVRNLEQGTVKDADDISPSPGVQKIVPHGPFVCRQYCIRGRNERVRVSNKIYPRVQWI